jgi:hypothetical protein
MRPFAIKFVDNFQTKFVIPSTNKTDYHYIIEISFNTNIIHNLLFLIQFKRKNTVSSFNFITTTRFP